MKKIGTFAVNGQGLVIGDPCYDNLPGDLGLLLQVPDAESGNWNYFIDVNERGEIRSALVMHDSFPDGEAERMSKEHGGERIGRVGVDSGQVCFASLTGYQADATVAGLPKMGDPGCPADEEGWRNGHSDFYRALCYMSLKTEDGAGTWDTGGNSTTAYGDGEYPVYCMAERSAFRVDFTDDDEPGDWEDEDWMYE